PEGADSEVIERLKAYTALDNPIRLRAFRLIHDSPGVPFHEIAKHIRIESGLLAYHLGVLAAAGVVDVASARQGRPVTSYRLGGETITPMPPAKTRASPRVPARMLVFLFRIATSSRKRRRSAALEGLGSTLPDSRDLI